MKYLLIRDLQTRSAFVASTFIFFHLSLDLYVFWCHHCFFNFTFHRSYNLAQICCLLVLLKKPFHVFKTVQNWVMLYYLTVSYQRFNIHLCVQFAGTQWRRVTAQASSRDIHLWYSLRSSDHWLRNAFVVLLLCHWLLDSIALISVVWQGSLSKTYNANHVLLLYICQEYVYICVNRRNRKCDALMKSDTIYHLQLPSYV